MQIAIWGAGAVGLGFAATLARAGERLDLVARDPLTIEAVTRSGVARSGLFGDRLASPDQLRLHPKAAALAECPPDYLLICTKAFAAPSVAEELAPFADRLRAHTRLVLCQNGWGNETPFLPFWPKERLFHARVITGFHRRRPEAVEITAHAEPVAFGSLFEAPVRELAPLAARLEEGGLPAETADDMRAVLWAKMLYNCALNPLGALAGRRYGELTEDPTTRPLVEGVIHEIYAVLDAAGIQVAWPDAADYLEVFHAQLIPPTARHESSMLQDLRAGRPTEIEALCGAVERLGRRVGVETPIVSSLAQLVRVAEQRAAP